MGSVTAAREAALVIAHDEAFVSGSEDWMGQGFAGKCA